MYSFKDLNLEYDHGVHLIGTILWFDPTKKQDMSAVSNARTPLSERHKKVLWGDRTARLVCRVNPKRSRGLVCPNHRPFSLGSATVELFPSGYMAGASQFYVTAASGLKLIYSGPFSLRPNRTAEAIEIRESDALVVDSTYGHSRYKFPKRKLVYNQIIDWVKTCQKDGAVPVLLSANPGKAQDLVHLLGKAGFRMRVHRSIYAYNKAYLDIGVDLPSCKQFRGSPNPLDVVIWPSHLRKSAAIRRLRKSRVAATSGLGCLPGIEKRLRVDTVFTWSARADYKDIVEYIQRTNAKTIVTIGRHAIDLAEALKTKHALDATPLLPSPQLALALNS